MTEVINHKNNKRLLLPSYLSNKIYGKGVISRIKNISYLKG
jgi:hypothetical protein